jgi:hypothetical protein
MNQDTVSRLSGLQIAVLAFLASAGVAVAVYFGLRRGRIPGRFSSGRTTRHTDVPGESGRPSHAADTPHHFSEDLIVPGFTHTGDEIAEQDAEQGRSSEGV